MFTKLGEFINDESAATAVEYGLVVALVGIASMLALGDVGRALSGMFERVANELNGALP